MLSRLLIFLSCLQAHPTGAPPTTMPGELRVMSFNIRHSAADDRANAWPRRRELLLATIERSSPDILGVQEALADQIDALREHLRGYAFVGTGRNDGERKGEFVPVFFRSDRFEAIGQGHFWLSETPDVPGSVSWDSSLTRMASWIKLRDRANGGRTLLVINTHWDHRGEEARRRSAELIAARIAALKGDEATACILLGDLNCDESSAAYRKLIDRSFVDAYRAVHPVRAPEEATFHGFKGTTLGARIDFVFTLGELLPIDAQIDRSRDAARYPSDHYPVIVKLRYK